MANQDKKKYQQQYDQFTGDNQMFDQDQAKRSADTRQWGNTALQTWGDYVGAGIDPQAINQARQTGQKGVADYSQMVGGLAANPGYSQQEQQAMRSGITNPVSAAFSTAQGQMARSAASSGNAGAAQANIMELGREKARTLAPMLSGLQGRFADARIQGQQAAITAQSAVPGMAGQQFNQEMTNTGQLAFPVQQLADQTQATDANRLNIQQQKLSGTDMQRQQANQPSFLKQLALAGIGGASQAASAWALPKI